MTTQFKLGGLFGLGMGVLSGFAISEARSPNTDWLALIPVFLFGFGFMLAGVMLARTDASKASQPDPYESPTP
jgi:hypothetical protein